MIYLCLYESNRMKVTVLKIRPSTRCVIPFMEFSVEWLRVSVLLVRIVAKEGKGVS